MAHAAPARGPGHPTPLTPGIAARRGGPGGRGAWEAWLMIVGIGVDVADISRLDSALRRTPALADRLFADSERELPMPSLAGCFAAKEATAKALGGPAGLRWTDVIVAHDSLGRPLLEVRGTVAAAAERLGVAAWHLSISHDAGVCIAMVVAER